MTLPDLLAALGRLAAAAEHPIEHETYVNVSMDLADLRACAEVGRVLGILQKIVDHGVKPSDPFWEDLKDIPLTSHDGASAHSDLPARQPGPTEQAAARGEIERRCGCGLTEAQAFEHAKEDLRPHPLNHLGHYKSTHWLRCALAARTRELDEARAAVVRVDDGCSDALRALLERDHAIAEAARECRRNSRGHDGVAASNKLWRLVDASIKEP